MPTHQAPAQPAPTPDDPSRAAGSGLADIASVAGYALAISYPVLALSTGVRAVYQLFFKAGATEVVGPSLSALAAACYLVATVGFAYRRRWSWYLSFGVLAFESAMTLVVGTLSYAYPEVIGRTAWGHFGADYGYFPLVQPLLGLLWLAWPVTLAAYGVAPRWLPGWLFRSPARGHEAAG